MFNVSESIRLADEEAKRGRFTREDVELLNAIIREYSLAHLTLEPCSCEICRHNREVRPLLVSLRARIEALLPPE